MKCPNDDTTLAMTERQGIEIDYCPTCRGVWLDRGELDKLIASGSSTGSAPEQHDPRPQHATTPTQEHYQPRNHYKDESHGYQKKHKRESFLGDLFDF